MVDEGIALPRFMAEVKNQTVTAGRAARLTCKVKDLGNYKVRNIIHNTVIKVYHCMYCLSSHLFFTILN